MKRLLFALLAGCLSGVCSAQLSGSISIYSNRSDLVQDGHYARWIREFTALHPGTKVDVVVIHRFREEIENRFNGPDYADVEMVPTNMPKQALARYFLPLNDLGLADQVYFADSWRFDGNDYAYAQGVSVEGLIYNRKVLQQAGIDQAPANLDELFAACEKIKPLGKTPFYLNVGAKWPLELWDKLVIALAQDGNYYSEMIDEPSPFVAGKPYYQSIQIANTLFKKGCAEDDFILNQWQQSKEDFGNDKIGMVLLGSWAIPQFIAQGAASDDIGFVPFPIDNSVNKIGVVNFDWGIGVNKQSRNPEVAKAWVKYLLTRSDFADVSGFVPTVKQRKSNLPQLAEYMRQQTQLLQTSPFTSEFLRLANRSGIDFLGGNHIRAVLLSPDFEGSMAYWNTRWQQARNTFF